MAIIAIKTNKCLEVDTFMADTNKRLKLENFVKNPFTGKIKEIDVYNNESYWLIMLKPLYFPFYYFGLLLAFVPIFINMRWSNFAIPGLIVYSLGFFYSGLFFSIILRIGLRKANYKGKIKAFSNKELIERLIYK